MKLYVAPLEGITGYIFRNAFNDFFGTGVAKYYTPFLSLCPKKGFTDKEEAEVAPENNQSYKLVPQVMTVSADDFQKVKYRLRGLGYEEINLNLGCPARTVTAKGRGAGALGNLKHLEHFLDSIFSDGDKNISIKTRIGIESLDEFDELMRIYNQFPIKELTIHPRLLKELYRGTPHRDIFMKALSSARMPICYNGDINTVEDFFEFRRLLNEGPNGDISAVMIGRGILKDPALIRKICAVTDSDMETAASDFVGREASNQEVLGMLMRLQKDYADKFYGDTPVLYKLKEIWAYLGQGIYADYGKLVKKIMKSKSLKEYEAYMRQIVK